MVFIRGGEFDFCHRQSFILPHELIYFPDMTAMRNSTANLLDHGTIAKHEHLTGVMDRDLVFKLCA
jgi:hypothetical protein